MKDPTRTAAIRKAWESQLKRRFRRLRGRVNKQFAQGRIPLDADYVEFFDAWFAREVALLFAGDWQERYVEQAYLQGMAASNIATTITAADREAMALLKRQASTEVASALNVMKSQASERLAQGILERSSKSKLAKTINDRVNKIGQTRSLLVANTSPAYSSNVAEVKAAEAIGGEIKMLWITRQDERVRTAHALINQKLFSPKVAMNLLGDPNCRCRVKPVMADASKLKGYAEIRRQGIEVSTQSQVEQRLFEVSKTQALGFFN